MGSPHCSPTGRHQRAAWQHCRLNVMWPGQHLPQHPIPSTSLPQSTVVHTIMLCASLTSHQLEPVNPPSSLREATQMEKIVQIRVMIICVQVFLKLNVCFPNHHKTFVVFAIATILHHHSFARAHCPICPPNTWTATTAAPVTIDDTGIGTFIIVLSWVSVVLTPQMSLHECLLVPLAWGGGDSRSTYDEYGRSVIGVGNVADDGIYSFAPWFGWGFFVVEAKYTSSHPDLWGWQNMVQSATMKCNRTCPARHTKTLQSTRK